MTGGAGHGFSFSMLPMVDWQSSTRGMSQIRFDDL